MVEFNALPFPSSKKIKIWSFHVAFVQAGTAKKCTKKRNARAELLFCEVTPLLFDVPVAAALEVS